MGWAAAARCLLLLRHLCWHGDCLRSVLVGMGRQLKGEIRAPSCYQRQLGVPTTTTTNASAAGGGAVAECGLRLPAGGLPCRQRAALRGGWGAQGRLPIAAGRRGTGELPEAALGCSCALLGGSFCSTRLQLCACFCLLLARLQLFPQPGPPLPLRLPTAAGQRPHPERPHAAAPGCSGRHG